MLDIQDDWEFNVLGIYKDRMAPVGILYLDEYFSLTFSGARIASDEFLAGKQAQLEKAPRKTGDFERRYAAKVA